MSLKPKYSISVELVHDRGTLTMDDNRTELLVEITPIITTSETTNTLQFSSTQW